MPGPETAVSACAPSPDALLHRIVRSTTMGSLEVTSVENSAAPRPPSVAGSIVVRVPAARLKGDIATGVVWPLTMNDTLTMAEVVPGLSSAMRVENGEMVAPSAR